jgi:hypothetical protein
LSANFADEPAAVAGMKAVEELVKKGRETIKEGREKALAGVVGDGQPAPIEKLPEIAAMLFGLGALERLDAFLAKPPVKRDRNGIKISTTMPNVNYSRLTKLAVLGSAVTASLYVNVKAAEVSRAQLDVKAIETGLKAYMIKNDGMAPDKLDDMKSYFEKGTTFTDPWGKKYQYDPKGPKHGGEFPDIWTVTPEKRTIGNWLEK